MERENAERHGLTPLARFVAFAVGGVRPDIMGIGPLVAVPKALKLAGLNLEDMDLIELNEAFASQSLAVIRELGMDMEKVNVNGGAIALGHPMGATGAKLTVHADQRVAPPRWPLRHGDDVRRRRHGRGGHLRTVELTLIGKPPRRQGVTRPRSSMSHSSPSRWRGVRG